MASPGAMVRGAAVIVACILSCGLATGRQAPPHFQHAAAAQRAQNGQAVGRTLPGAARAEAGGLRLRGGGMQKGGGPEEPLLCRYKKGGTHFEILCVSGMVEKFREGEATRDEVVIGDEVYKDTKTGNRPSAAELEAAFGTTEVGEIIDMILEKGEFQMSVAERKKKTDDKLAAIVTYIHTNYMDGRTKLPIPAARIQSAIEYIKGLKIDPLRSTTSQAHEIAKKIKDTLQLAKNEICATVTVGLGLAGVVGGALHNVATVDSEDYTETHAIFEIKMMTNDYDRVLTELNVVAKGEFEMKTEREDPIPAAHAGEVAGAGAVASKGGKKKNKGG